MTIYGIHAYITLMNWSQFYITLCYNYCMRNRIRHNYPSLIHCLQAFHILFFAYLLFRCYCYNQYKTQKQYSCYRYLYYHTTFATKYFAADIKFPGVVEFTTQLLILENILWLPLCRINKFRLNTLPPQKPRKTCKNIYFASSRAYNIYFAQPVEAT